MTDTGRWALRLDAGGLTLLALGIVVVALSNLHAFGLVAFVGLVLLVAGGAVGALAAIRDHERSRLVVVGFLPALFALFLLIGELVGGH